MGGKPLWFVKFACEVSKIKHESHYTLFRKRFIRFEYISYTRYAKVYVILPLVTGDVQRAYNERSENGEVFLNGKYAIRAWLLSYIYDVTCYTFEVYSNEFNFW